jgi:hypothetical protein
MSGIVMWVACDDHQLPGEFCHKCRTAVDLNTRQCVVLSVPARAPWGTPDGRRP